MENSSVERSVVGRSGGPDNEDLDEVTIVEEEEGEQETDVLTKEWNSKVEKAKLKVRLHHLLYLLMFFGFVGSIGSCIYLRWTAKTHRLERIYNCTVTNTQAAKCSEGPGLNCADLEVSLFLCNETLNGTLRVEIPPSQINSTYPIGSYVECYATGEPTGDSDTTDQCKIVPQSSKTDIVTACFFLLATIASTASCGYCVFWRKFRGARVVVKRTHYDEL